MFSITEQVSTRLAAGVCFALIASGCGGSRSPVQSSVPNGPANLYTITGVVAESGRPIEAARVNAWVQFGSGGYQIMRAHGALLTDGDGRYRITDLPASASVWLQVFKDGYVQQCAVGPVTVQGDVAINVALVSTANLTAIAQSAPGFRSVSGMVVQTTSTGEQPVAGAYVDFEPVEDFTSALTYSDRSGRFALCGLPVDATVRLGASSGGRVAFANVPPGKTSDVEIVLP